MNDFNSKNLTTLASRIILVLVSEHEESFRLNELEKISTSKVNDEDFSGFLVKLDNSEIVCIILISDINNVVTIAKKMIVSAIIIDNRTSEKTDSFSSSTAGKALPEIIARVSSLRRPSRSGLWIILPEGPKLAYHAYAAGSLQLGGIIVEPNSILDAIESVCRSVKETQTGKVALCLAGGGIEGMFYELGVLRALDSFLVNKSITDIDIFSGISAGGIILAFLANNISPRELAFALKGKSSRIDPVTRGMLFDPNLVEIAARLSGAVKDILKGEWLKTPLDTALRITPTAIFSGDRLRWYLESQFGKPGLTNDFQQLKKKLFIGVTDQDTAAHLTFGEEGFDDVPISHAVRASCAMTPYYPPEKIKGRYYIDGIFTRAVNLDIAVAHGATLVICIDPLTPISADQAGYVSGRGGFFNTVQSVKSMIRTRLSELIGRAEEAYPNVSIVVFSPTPKDLEKMSGTMMRFFYKTETEQMAFDSTVERIKEEWSWLSTDFQRHGFTMKEPS